MRKMKEIDYTSVNKHKNLYNCNSREIYIEKIANLKLAKQILESDKEEMQKVYEILILFSKNKNGFDRAYGLFLENGKDDPELKDCYEYIDIISKQIKKWQENGLENDARLIWKLFRDMERKNFDSACQVLMGYIEFKGTSIDDYCNECGIAPLDFEKYRNVVFSIASNSKLYKKFLEKSKSDIEIEYQEIVNNFIDIADAIKTGVFKDGTKFSELEFWARIPFRNATVKQFNKAISYLNVGTKLKFIQFRGAVNNFTKILVQMNIMSNEQYQTLNNYLITNNIGDLLVYNEVDIRHYANGIVSGSLNNEDNSKIIYNINDDEIKKLIEYMKSRKMPMNYKVFNIVFEAYVSGDISNISNFIKTHSRGELYG